MRKVIASTFVSLDGVMQGPGGPDEDTSGGFTHGGWVFPYFDDTVGKAVDAIFAQPYDLLLGRKTYDIFAAFWPTAEGGEDADIAKGFNAATKYVATTATDKLPWERSVALHDAAAEVARLKLEDGKNLVIQGSGVLMRALHANGLIDEMTVMTFPVVLGKGKRLFDDSAAAGALKFQRATTSPSGVVIATYGPDGAVKTGSFNP